MVIASDFQIFAQSSATAAIGREPNVRRLNVALLPFKYVRRKIQA